MRERSAGPDRGGRPLGRVPAQLTGTGLLADDLYLVAHDDVTGRAVVQPRALGLGLAAGLLAELILGGLIDVADGQVVMTRPRRPGERGEPPGDPLAGRVLGRVAGEGQPRAVADWLAFLAQRSARDVAVRLSESGYLTWVASRSRWRRAGRWVPADPDCAFVALARARAALDPARDLTADGTALTGLACACGLEPRVMAYVPPGLRRPLPAATALLPPGLRELIARTRAAVDSALLAHRI
jgi:hypothetical protein